MESLRLLAVAARFLTRLPVPVAVRQGDLRRAAPAFPLVGLVVATVGVAARAAVAPWWGAGAATVVAVVAMVAVTGALHEDGLADAADGLWGGWDPERRIEIMRDSRLGTYGVVAVVSLLALRVALLAPLELSGFARAVVCGAVLGRASSLALGGMLPAASPGSGSQVVGEVPLGGTALAAATVAVVLAAAAGRWAPVPAMAAAVVAVAAAHLFRRRLGGVTGDALGAANAVADVAAVAAVSALVQGGLL